MKTYDINSIQNLTVKEQDTVTGGMGVGSAIALGLVLGPANVVLGVAATILGIISVVKHKKNGQ